MADYKAAIDLLLLGIEHEHDKLVAFYEQNVDFLRLVDDDFGDDLNGDVEDEIPHFPVREILPVGPEPVPILVPLMAPEEEEERPRREIVEYREFMRINGSLDLELPFLPGQRNVRVVARLHAEGDADVGPDARAAAGREGIMGRSVDIALGRRRREDEVEDGEAEYEADEEEEDDAGELAEEEAPETEEDEDWEHIPKPTNTPSSSSEKSIRYPNDSSDSDSSTWSTTVHIEQEQDEKQESLIAKLWTLLDFCRAFVVASSRELAEKPGAAQRPRSFLEVFG